MSLPWVRLDSNIASHPKVLRLLAAKDGHRAFTLYVCALGYAGGHATDGFIPAYALPVLHGTDRLATVLVLHRLWEPTEVDGDRGWSIRNYAQRQELALVTESKRAAQRLAGRRTSCRRWHGPECNCWRDDGDATVLPMAKGGR